MKRILVIPLLLIASLLLPSPTSLTAANAPAVVTDPAVIEPENKEVKKTEAALLVEPQTATQHTDRFLIRGSGWGRYDDRGEPAVLLMTKDGTDEGIPLVLERNYRDCSFVKGDKIQGGCTMDEGDMLMAAKMPVSLKAGVYIVYVTTENGFEGAAEFRLVQIPDFSNAKRPIISIQPTSGPVGTNVLLALGGFPKRTGLFLRFDGVKLPGVLYTDTNGAVGEYTFSIPSTLTKDFKTITIKPGKHTVEVNDGAGLFQTVTFTVTEKTEEPKKEEPKKEEPKKEEPKKEEPKKEEPKKEEPKKEEPKKEEPKKEEPKKEEPKKENRFEGKPCDPVLPRLWQQGCIDETSKKEEMPVVKMYVPDSSGKQCRDDIAITFQPGCIPVTKPSETSRFLGQICDPILPRSWQQGCVEAGTKAGKTLEGKQYCDPTIPRFSQPGCVEQEAEKSKDAETNRFVGKQCDPVLPRLWQPGCIPPATESSGQKTTTPSNSVIQTPASGQSKTTQKCNPLVPRYSQSGCID